MHKKIPIINLIRPASGFFSAAPLPLELFVEFSIVLILLVLVLEVGNKVNFITGRRLALQCSTDTNSTEFLLHRITFINSFIHEAILLKTSTSIQNFIFQQCSIKLFVKILLFAMQFIEIPHPNPYAFTFSASASSIPAVWVPIMWRKFKVSRKYYRYWKHEHSWWLVFWFC